VRAQWGQHIEWRDKRWIAHEWFLLPEQIDEQFGVECDPDSYVGDDEAGGAISSGCSSAQATSAPRP
jgi:hypothetical protein